MLARVLVAVLGGCLAAACTAVRAAPPPSEERARSADGVPLAYESAGVGEPTLVFVHGWCGSRQIWRATLAEFGARERVVALDLAGHGDSGAQRARWTLDALAADVVAVVQASGAREVILVGHSMGATVALLAAPRLRALENAPRVFGLIAVEGLHDPDFSYPPGFLERVATELRGDFPRALEASLRGVAGPSTLAEHLSWLMEAGLRADRGAALGLLAGLEGFELGAALRAAGVPVRAINAAPRPGGGLATALERNREFADYQALLLDGCGHFPMLEQPVAFRAALARWVDELRGDER
jgi:pimeloyl-ACP methyl ester carboxylesterase